MATVLAAKRFSNYLLSTSCVLMPCVDSSGHWADTGKEPLLHWIITLDLSERDTLFTHRTAQEGRSEPAQLRHWGGMGAAGSVPLTQPDPTCSARQARLGVTVLSSLQLWWKQTVNHVGQSRG